MISSRQIERACQENILFMARSYRRYLSTQVDTQPPNLIDAMKAKIDTPQGRQIYARRLGIDLCQHLCAETKAPLHPTLQT